VVDHLHDFESLVASLRALGRRHRAFFKVHFPSPLLFRLMCSFG
jgi:hypothetical protein